ncbi:hypothetical protein V494_06474 [Pseudogymnoascus sp. VKM F-4513 (FW-928)]|nr:hypothetical protein V494_06474 [Pseudogymnoascus sp. VKM F-4513 (FW-928)]
MHATATVNGQIIAETDNYEVVEGNIYFPPGYVTGGWPMYGAETGYTDNYGSSVDQKVFTKSDTSTHCPWKGDASYYNITTGKTELKDAAWYYPETFEKASHIKNYVAFYKTKVNVKSD